MAWKSRFKSRQSPIGLSVYLRDNAAKKWFVSILSLKVHLSQHKNFDSFLKLAEFSLHMLHLRSFLSITSHTMILLNYLKHKHPKTRLPTCNALAAWAVQFWPTRFYQMQTSGAFWSDWRCRVLNFDDTFHSISGEHLGLTKQTEHL